jgi:hypothetical protein
MVSTVTISTVTIIATSSIAAGAIIFAIVFLIGLLASKEILGASSDNRKRLIGKSLNISIIPLLIGFTIIVAMKIAELLT